VARKPDKGYRVSRLKARRRERLQRWQFVVLVLLAVAVTLGAIFGAYTLVKRLSHHAAPVDARTGLVLLTVGAHDSLHKPIAALALYDPVLSGWRLFALPRELLLESASGAYVMAGDAMGSPALSADLARLTRAKVTREIAISYASLIKLAGGGPFGVQLAQPATVQVDDLELCPRFTARVLTGVRVGESTTRRLHVPIKEVVGADRKIPVEPPGKQDKTP